MSLRGCFGCLKFLVFVVNFLFWLSGLGVMAVSLWLLFDQQLYLQSIGADQTDYYMGTYFILGVGGIMTLVGFLGCCGAWKESSWMLGTFFMLLVIIFLFEVAVGVLLYFQHVPYHDVIRKWVDQTVTKKYHSDATATTQTFDIIQEGLQCCGSDDPRDWSRSVYNGYRDKPVPEIGIPPRNHNDGSTAHGLAVFRLPKSCCQRPERQECADAVERVQYNSIPVDVVNERGCSDALIRFAEKHVIYLMAVAGGVIVIQMIGMVFSLCLCCALRKIDDFKA